MRGILGTLFPNDSVTVPETVQISLVLPDVDVTSGETGVVYHTLDFIPPVKPLSTELYPLLTNLIRDVPEVASVTDPTIPRSNVFATLTFSEPLLQAPPASTRRVLDAGQYPDAWSTLSTAFGADLTALSGATLSQPGTNENSPASGVSFSVTVSRILFVSGSTVLGLVLSSDAELSETGNRAATLRDTLNRASAPFRGLFPSTVLILQEVLNRLTASDSMSGASTLFPSGTLTWNDVSTVVTTHVTLDLDGIPFESKYGTPSLELMKPFANALAADYHGSLGLPLSQLRMVNFRSDPVTVSSNGSSGESPFTGGSAADSSSLLLGLDVSYVLFESGKEVKGPRWPEGYATFLIFRSWFRTALPDTASVNRSVTQALKVSSKASVDEPLLGGIRFDGFDFYPPEQCTDGCKAIAIVTVMMGTALLVTACAMCAVWKERSIHSK